MPKFDTELDTSGLSCPMPVMKAKKALKDMGAGQVLHLIATDPASTDDVAALLPQIGCKLESSNKDGGAYHFYIKKG
ncbi:MAG: sulfurtransferase TusA family protein [Gammaproteobacteria bacterium]|nr:sulfurtransferase TusA family protein [Gammaproteobacteria bacterium]MBU2477612.1 sulfurtransferase TusA family protein [Gammaproteobacteria bacterium]